MEQLINKIQNKYPYEYLGNQLLINGDCLDVMELIDDKSVDLVLTDPPYGININHNMGRRKGDKPSNYAKVGWDDEPASSELFIEIFRISENQIIWGANHFIDRMPINSPCWFVWDKTFSEDVSFAQLEMAWTSFNKTCKKFVKHPSQQDRIHPTQKPVELFSWCLMKNSNDNDLILDAFAGSFTTSIACIRTNRQSICIEKDEEYYKLGVNRVKEELRQGDMFRLPPKAKL